MKFRKKLLKTIFSMCLAVSLISSCLIGVDLSFFSKEITVEAATTNYELLDNIQDGSILHCWNWSYKTIEDHMQLIAECGYSAIQTSPCTQPKDYTYEGFVGTNVGIPGYDSLLGNWWKVYQPVTFSVCDNGETWFGTKDELVSMCNTAEKYGIKVIVDIVANHMGNITGWKNSLSDVSPQVGEYWNPDMLVNEDYWHINEGVYVHSSDSRYHFTMGCMGMPDLNTANKTVQRYVYEYLDELIDCGVDGFRFDAAKHIETPDDSADIRSDFWPTVLGEAKSHYKSKTGKNLYVYGEILNTVGLDFSIDNYTKYMSVTDNSAGNHLLDSIRNNNIGTLSMDYSPSVSVLWAESHDTYMNESSRYASDKSIVRTWSIVANKDNAATLFYVRPYYSNQILQNDMDGSLIGGLDKTLEQAQMGECPTYVWASKEVAAINHFNNRFASSGDSTGSDGNIMYCKRGNGIILVHFDGSGKVNTSAHGLSSGTYTDEVSGNTFTVSGGNISGTITSEYGIAVIYQNVMPNPSTSRPAQISVSQSNGSIYYTNGLSVTITAKNATSASYTASTGETGSISGSKTITIGKNLSDGQSVTLTVNATSSFGKITKTYIYTKDSHAVEISASKPDGSKIYGDGKVTFNALYADNATYKIGNAKAVSFTDSIELNLGTNLNDGEKVTVVITGTSSKGTKTESFTYTKKEGSNFIYFKNTSKWSEVYAYAWNDKVTPSVNNAKWPGQKMELVDQENNIYAIELDQSKELNKIIFNYGSSQTTDLSIASFGQMYDYGAKSWIEYDDNKDALKISASKESGSFNSKTNVVFTVENAKTATYSINGAKEVAFTGSVTLAVADGNDTTVVINASNDSESISKTYNYTYSDTPAVSYVYLKNTANWSTPTVYMWTGSTSNGDWPGVKMTLVEGKTNIYRIALDTSKGYTKVIFNNNGGSQTADLELKGAGYIFDNGTSTWSKYEEETIKGTVNIKYVDESGKSIATSESISGNVGTNYSTTAKNISGYTLKTTPANASGKYTEKAITVTYTYTKVITTSGWIKKNNIWYYYDLSGNAVTGWNKISNKWYYFEGTGAMVTGWKQLGTKWYYFESTGAMVSGWKQLGAKWYYFESTGAMVSGWKQLGTKWYYFENTGVMVTGWKKIGTKWYYFETSGVMQKSKWIGNYYMKADGSMAVSEWVDNGKYYVGSDGVWVKNP